MISAYKYKRIKNNSLALFCLALLFFAPADSQDLPKKIRGYKVYQTKISIKNQDEKSAPDKNLKDESETFVRIGEPQIKDVSLTGITLEISAEINSVEQTGTIDFLAFKDFRVNDLPIEIAEYKEPFDLKKNQSTVLPKPIEILVGAKQTLRGAVKEMRESKKEWTVTGRVFVFGHFKKSFLKFKRVVPVDINLKIKNPLLSLNS